MNPQVGPATTNRFNPKNLILLFLLFFLLIIIVVVQLFRPQLGKQTTNVAKAGELQIISVSPNPSDSIDLASNLEITFNKPISPNHVYLETSPFANINTISGQDPTKVLITPIGVWTDGQSYKITILKTTSSDDNSTLSTNYELNFTAKNNSKEVLDENSGGDH